MARDLPDDRTLAHAALAYGKQAYDARHLPPGEHPSHEATALDIARDFASAPSTLIAAGQILVDAMNRNPLTPETKETAFVIAYALALVQRARQVNGATEDEDLAIEFNKWWTDPRGESTPTDDG